MKLLIDDVSMEVNPALIADIKRQLDEYEKENKEPKTIDDCREILRKRNVISNWIGDKGIIRSHYLPRFSYNHFPSDKRPKQLLAIMQLMQVADALNGEDAVVPNVTTAKYTFYLDAHGEVTIGDVRFSTYGFAYFNSIEVIAKARAILGDEIIKNAYGRGL